MAASFHLIVNPSSGGGRGRRVGDEALSVLRARGAQVQASTSTSMAHALELARGAAQAAEVVVVIGGDGLVGAIAGELAGSGAVLGIVPGGRGNDFARTLGIGKDVAAACQVLLDGTTRAVDVGEATGPDGVARRFVGIVSIGYDSVCNELANAVTKVRGQVVYLYAALRALAGWRHAAFSLSADGEPIGFSGWSVSAANSAYYGGGMKIAPDASLTDGLLEVVLMSETGKLRFLRSLPKVFSGRHVDEPSVRIVRVAELTVDADRALPVYADGEPLTSLPVSIRLLPGALSVLVPE